MGVEMWIRALALLLTASVCFYVFSPIVFNSLLPAAHTAIAGNADITPWESLFSVMWSNAFLLFVIGAILFVIFAAYIYRPQERVAY